RAGWTAGFDPEVLKKTVFDGSPYRAQRASTSDGGFAEGGRQRKSIIYHFGRHRQRQDHPAECFVELRSPRSKAYHHRRRRRIAAPASACWANGDPTAERRRQRRDPPTRAREKRPSDASRSYHHRRVSRRGSIRHASGHEHRSRRLNDYGAREFTA